MVFGIRAPRSTSSASPSDSASRAFGKERGFTQVELAEKIGVIQSIVSALERDERKLSAEMAVRFAHALGVSLTRRNAPETEMVPFRNPAPIVNRPFTNAVNSNSPLREEPGVIPAAAFGMDVPHSRFSFGIGVLPDLASASTWNYADPPGAGGASYGLTWSAGGSYRAGHWNYSRAWAIDPDHSEMVGETALLGGQYANSKVRIGAQAVTLDESYRF
jgi:transcriptional regulator with XRE-family HTH domain